MTVAELIEKLKTANPDAMVYAEDGQSMYTLTTFYIDNDGDVQLS